MVRLQVPTERAMHILRPALLPLPAACVALVLSVSAAVAQNPAARPECIGMLGGDFDEQASEVKNVRLSRYFDCRFRRDLGRLKHARNDILTDLDAWKRRAGEITQNSIYNSRLSIAAEMTDAHETKRTSINNEFAQRAALLEQDLSDSIRSDRIRRRNQLEAQHKSALRDMATRHGEQKRQVDDHIDQCRRGVRATIHDLYSRDRADINSQFQSKSDLLEIRYSALRNTPMDQSVNEYLAANGDTTLSTGTDDDYVAAIAEGDATIVRDGQFMDAPPGSALKSGDTVLAGPSGCEIVFIDESTISISAGVATKIDEADYGGDEGESLAGFYLPRSLFEFTSKLIGRKEPTEVKAVYGSLGIRG